MAMSTTRREVPAGLFKQGCLALLNEVASSKQEIIITKRGKPVALLVPMEDPLDRERELLAQWRGKAPADRFIVATALRCKAPLVTKD